MKTINFKQKITVIESYKLEYDERDFELDCENYHINGLSYEEICAILDGSKEDILITATEYYVDENENYLHGPHIVSAKEFFSTLLCDICFENGYDDRYEIEIADREIYIVE